MVKNALQFFVEDVEEIILRLHAHLINSAEKNKDFENIENFIGSPKGKFPFSIKNAEEEKRKIKEYKEYKFYQGKFYAYLYVLERLGSDVPDVIKRLRGLKKVGNTMFETKRYETEKFGHKQENISWEEI